MNTAFFSLPLMQTAGSSAQMMSTIIMFGAMAAIFYFLIMRPQNKRRKEAQKMIEAMKKGDKVVTIGGIHGVITSVKDKTVVVKVDDSSKLEFTKSAIASVEPRGEETDMTSETAK